MSTLAHATCPLCEANCGLRIEHDAGRVLSIRGDTDDPLSRGYLCPKAAALADLHADPDRLKQPLKRVGERWHAIGWDEALDEAAERIAAIQKQHGRSSVAMFIGNPTVHSYTAVLYGQLFASILSTRSTYSSNSVDALPRLLVSLWLYGSQARIPIPDVDRTQYLLVLGANPLVSNGSVMTAPDFRRRLRALKARGGRLVVIDPRRSETAAVADEHHFIRPGADALLLAAMVRVVLDEQLSKPSPHFTDLERLPALLAPFSPERVAPVTGISAETIRELARAFAGAPSAVCYGRLGTCTQEFGTLASWLVDVLNVVTGNLDRPGGAMFPTPAVDLAGFAARIGQSGHHGAWRSRVRGLPESNGELPAVALAEEIDTPGEGQLRGLITHAGNPVLSLPNGKRLEAALPKLDFMVSIDIYKNETTRHAHLILPTTFGLEHDHYPLIFGALAVHNVAKYAPAVLPESDGALHDWEVLSRLAARLLKARGGKARLQAPLVRWLGRLLPPRRLLDLLLRLGPHRMSLSALARSPSGVDLGPLEPRLAELTKGRKISITPEAVLTDLARLERRLGRSDNGGLVLIGRRHLRSNNSWMHNVERMVSGQNKCTLLVHPEDAGARGIASGDRVSVASPTGTIEVECEVTDEVARGVVSLPHGWGHNRDGVGLSVARSTDGASANDVIGETNIDELSGTASLTGIAVNVARA
jgi:anaerobic selenocysteine-containing dehydrogenase